MKNHLFKIQRRNKVKDRHFTMDTMEYEPNGIGVIFNLQVKYLNILSS